MMCRLTISMENTHFRELIKKIKVFEIKTKSTAVSQ